MGLGKQFSPYRTFVFCFTDTVLQLELEKGLCVLLGHMKNTSPGNTLGKHISVITVYNIKVALGCMRKLFQIEIGKCYHHCTRC